MAPFKFCFQSLFLFSLFANFRRKLIKICTTILIGDRTFVKNIMIGAEYMTNLSDSLIA